MNFFSLYFDRVKAVADLLDVAQLDKIIGILKETRERNGRLFIVGSGGGAGHASHAVCDFRKLCGIQAYCPTDNVSELTARINDEGWDTSIAAWLEGSRISRSDTILVFSVGGGSAEKQISMNLVKAVQKAKEVGASVIGIVGRDGGYTSKVANACVIVPTVEAEMVTPLTESFQAVVWHALVSHPELQLQRTKWESCDPAPKSKPQTKLAITKIFADGAELEGIAEMYRNPMISGFTTNPTLMKKAGILDYKKFSRDVLRIVHDRPLSFEVFSDELEEMEAQAREIASWGSNVYVKIPITNTKGASTAEIVKRLSESGVKVNVTAVMTMAQVREVLPALKSSPGAYLSIFAGRIADTGLDPLPIMKQTMTLLKEYPQVELIWASPRELFNIIQANEIGCHVITVTNDILKKLNLIGRDLTDYSLDTVKMFRNDAVASGFSLPLSKSIEIGVITEQDDAPLLITGENKLGTDRATTGK